jgi:hypothetical protein
MSKVSIKDIKGSENPNQVLQTDANGDPFYGPPPSSGGVDLVIGETPSGLINDVNMSFATANNYQSGGLVLYYNGVRQNSSHIIETGASSFDLDFTPLTGEELIIDYIKI